MSAPKHVIKITLGIVWLALSALAHADSITLTLYSPLAAPEYAFYTYTDTAGVVQSNVPVGPYIAVLNGGGYFNQSILVFCYDMNAETYVGQAYSGSVEPITSLTPPTSTEVLESTYLVNELFEDGDLKAPLATRGAISLAIWEIMNPTSTTKIIPFPTDPAAIPYEQQAAAAVANGSWTMADADQFPTWMPENIASVQRFGEETRTPEPATFVLTGLGLLGLGFLGLKSRVRAIKLV
jgi:hypothetical protein